MWKYYETSQYYVMHGAEARPWARFFSGSGKKVPRSRLRLHNADWYCSVNFVRFLRLFYFSHNFAKLAVLTVYVQYVVLRYCILRPCVAKCDWNTFPKIFFPYSRSNCTVKYIYISAVSGVARTRDSQNHQTEGGYWRLLIIPLFEENFIIFYTV